MQKIHALYLRILYKICNGLELEAERNMQKGIYSYSKKYVLDKVKLCVCGKRDMKRGYEIFLYEFVE